jgi:hypothetical protein
VLHRAPCHADYDPRMLLETNLDPALDSVRSEIRFMRELLGNFDGVELVAGEVRSRADLEKFLWIARTRRFGTIHTDPDALTDPLLVAETVE